MKKQVLTVLAVVAVIAFSAFTAPRFATVYFVYKATNPLPEKDINSYTFQSLSPGTKTGIDNIAWFRATVINASSPTLAEFNTAFELVDGDFGGANDDLLSDEDEEDHSQFEKRD